MKKYSALMKIVKRVSFFLPMLTDFYFFYRDTNFRIKAITPGFADFLGFDG